MLFAKYTEVLKNIMDDERGMEAINKAMSTYPLYERREGPREFDLPNVIPTREKLNKTILDYYKYREIGFETIGRFLDELEISLNEIMPRYNQLYFSADQDYNVIYNVDYRKTIDRERSLEGTNSSLQQSTLNIEGEANSSGTDSSTSHSEAESNDKGVRSDTPQNQLSITNKQIDEVDYANDVSWGKNNTDTDSTTNSSTSSNTTNSSEQTGNTSISDENQQSETEGIVETTKGNFGVVSAQDLILKYRETIMNITQDIINDPRITELFMLVY